jgi:UDP-N-acetylmuramate dehydrogenase
VRDAVIAIRRRKGMILDPADSDTRSDGSFFMNPVIGAAQFAEFEARARTVVGDEAKIPNFPSEQGVKLSAAWLIEHAGFAKGFAHGNAAISTKHTLAIVNRGSATAHEVLELARMIRDEVERTFGVRMAQEPNPVGFPDNPL